MYIHVKVRLKKFGQIGKKFQKKVKKVRKSGKIFHKNVTSCLNRREKIKIKMVLHKTTKDRKWHETSQSNPKLPQLLTNGPFPLIETTSTDNSPGARW